MIKDSGVAAVPQGAERVEIQHSLGIAPNIVTVNAPEGSRVYTLSNEALLIILPPGAAVGELAWCVGYERPLEPEPVVMEEVPVDG